MIPFELRSASRNVVLATVCGCLKNAEAVRNARHTAFAVYGKVSKDAIKWVEGTSV
jgi:hypothetical protein